MAPDLWTVPERLALEQVIRDEWGYPNDQSLSQMKQLRMVQ